MGAEGRRGAGCPAHLGGTAGPRSAAPGPGPGPPGQPIPLRAHPPLPAANQRPPGRSAPAAHPQPAPGRSRRCLSVQPSGSPVSACTPALSSSSSSPSWLSPPRGLGLSFPGRPGPSGVTSLHCSVCASPRLGVSVPPSLPPPVPAPASDFPTLSPPASASPSRPLAPSGVSVPFRCLSVCLSVRSTPSRRRSLPPRSPAPLPPVDLNQLTVHVPAGSGFPRAEGRELGALNPSLSAAGAPGVSWAGAGAGAACAAQPGLAVRRGVRPGVI